MRIANIDVDGVLYDFVDAMRQAFRFRHNITWGERYESDPKDWPDPPQWRIWEEWPVSYDEFYRIMYAEIREGHLFREGIPINGAKEGMARLQQAGFHLRIVTSKTFRDPKITEQARRHTMAWLDNQDIPYDTISFTDSVIGKTGYVADFIVDDKPRVESWVQPNAVNVIFDQPWNSAIPEMPDLSETSGSFRRARSWNDVVLHSLEVPS